MLSTPSGVSVLQVPTSPPLLLAPVLLLLAAFPSARLLAAAHALSLGVTIVKVPFVWDFLLWDLQTDATLLVVLLIADEERAIALAAPIVRLQYLLLYAFTALWKVNSAFLDPAVSCAPIFFVQLLDAYLPAALTPAWLPPLAVAIAPAATIAIEALIPALLGAPHPAAARAGLVLGLALHVLIALTPAPNNAGAFSVAVLVRYFFLAPPSFAAAATRPHALAAAAMLMCPSFSTTSWGGGSVIKVAGLRWEVMGVRCQVRKGVEFRKISHTFW